MGFISLEFIIIALVQSIGETEKYGLVIRFGGLISFSILGLLWLWTALTADFESPEGDKCQ